MENQLDRLSRMKDDSLHLWPLMTESERELHLQMLAGEIPFLPLPGPQTEAYLSQADELFFGGAAGGGKSYLLLGLALTQHKNSIIFRREYPQLRDLKEASRDLLTGTGAKFNNQNQTWRNIPGERMLEFGALQFEDDVRKYQGRSHDLICVEAGTPVLMENGSTLPIEQVRVGDRVQTLEGPGRVSRVLDMGFRECVRATAHLPSGPVSQVQSVDHPILTTCGWASYNTFCESRPSLTSAPISRRDASISWKSSCLPCATIRKPSLDLQTDPMHNEELSLCRADRQFWLASRGDMASKHLEISCAAQSGSIQARALLALSRPPFSGHRAPDLLSDHTCSGSWSEASDAQSVSSRASCPDYCLGVARQCDGHARSAEVSALLCPLPRARVEGQSPTCSSADYLDKARRYSHCKWSYVRPYTMEIGQSSVALFRSSVSFDPAGKRHVFDLTVDRYHNYITGSGFVNQNCFDEIPHFTKSQYQYTIGWNRTTDPNQRCRIVSAGNPPLTTEGEWIIQYWGAWLDSQHTNPARPGELRWYAMINDEQVERENGDPFDWKGETIMPKSRTFIPARVTDNPFLMATDYVARLQAMPEPMRSKLLYGDFGVGFKDDPWQVIPTQWVIDAQDRWRPDRVGNRKLSAMGVDVAHGGEDQTVVAKRYGNWFDHLYKYAGTETPDGQSVARIVANLNEGNVAPCVDVIGVGASAYDIMVMQGMPVEPVNFAESSEEVDRSGQLGFVNKRAEFYWQFREMLDPNSGENIALPPDRELRADLCAARWRMTSRGIQIESKNDIRKRLGRSPDCADAVVLASRMTKELGWEFL